MANDGLIVGLDIGSTKTCAVVGERDENGLLEITGVGTSPSTGLRKGVVVNIEATLRSIQAAVEAAEMMSGHTVSSCWTGIGGSHIDFMNTTGVVAVTGKNRELREISSEDVDRVIDVAGKMKLPMDRLVLEVVPQSFVVDGQRGIRDPLNMIGVRLEAEVHIVTCAVTGAQNLVKCVNRAGFLVNAGLPLLKTLAAARAVLTAEEKDLGVALIDMGGGTTDFLVYSQGAPFCAGSVPVGGAQVTNDISLIKNISLEVAERIKLDYGCCWEPLLQGIEENIAVPGVGGRAPMQVSRAQIAAIARSRVEETFSLVQERLDKLTLGRSLGGGIVLTGGGAEFYGAVELAQEVFRLPTRIGSPLQPGFILEEYKGPAYATAIGLVMEGYSREGNEAAGERRAEGGSIEKGIPFFSRLVEWLKKEFF